MTTAIAQKSVDEGPVHLRSAQIEHGPEIARTTVLIKLERAAFGNTRKLKKEQYEVPGADKEDTSASRKLLRSPELDAVRHVMNESYRYVTGIDISLPFPIESVHMIPLTKVSDVNYQLKKFETAFWKAVDKFIEMYPQRVREAKQRNPKVFNPLDYTAVEYVRREFDFRYQFVTIGVPEQQLANVDPEILNESRRSCDRLWADAAEMTRQMQVEIMQRLVGNLREKLEGDTKKQLRSVTVEALNDFIRQFTSTQNVTNFAELERLVERARKTLAGTDAGMLKDSAQLRDKVHADLSAIEKKLIPLVADRKVRRTAE